VADDEVGAEKAENVLKIGSGGRLYADARKRDAKKDGGEKEDLPRGADRPDLPPQPLGPPAIPWIGPTPPESETRDWRGPVSTVVELLGAASFTAGFWLLAPWLGLVVLGSCLILIGVATGTTPISGRGRKP
jgi:hypothetical protein